MNFNDGKNEKKKTKRTGFKKILGKRENPELT
jgi:hypothetical protein